MRPDGAEHAATSENDARIPNENRSGRHRNAIIFFARRRSERWREIRSIFEGAVFDYFLKSSQRVIDNASKLLLKKVLYD